MLIGIFWRWHGGIHFDVQTGTRLDQDTGVRCIADGEVVAYRIDDDYPTVPYASCGPATYSTGFVLVRHRLQLPSEPKSNASNANTASTADDTAASAAVAAPTSGSARSSASAEEPSLLFYSLYMHLLNWKSYQQDSTLKRPAHWGEETYLVGERASDSLGNHPGNSHIPKNGIGMNLRDAQNRYIGFAPRGTKLILGERRGRSGYYAVTRIIGTVVPEGITGAYVFKGELTPAGTEPAAKGTVVILDPPIEINGRP